MDSTPTINPAALRILGVDPGTRELGWAVLEGEELLAFGVRTIPYGLPVHDLLREGEAVVDQLLATFEPQILVIEHTFWVRMRRAAILRILVSELKRRAQARGIRVLGYAPTAVKKAVAGHGHAPKVEVAKAVVRRWPRLSVYMCGDPHVDERYWGNMFDAVALAMTARRRFDR